MIVQAIRSLLFYLLFLGQTVLLAILLGTITLFLPKDRPAPPFMWRMGRYWGYSNLAFLRFVVGIKSEVEGAENIPPGGCIIASKHQSDWDIVAILPHAPLPAFIAKRQLMDIPFFGWAAKLFNTISVDRKRGSDAIPAMLAEAQAKVANGSQIIIFPRARGAPRWPSPPIASASAACMPRSTCRWCRWQSIPASFGAATAWCCGPASPAPASCRRSRPACRPSSSTPN